MPVLGLAVMANVVKHLESMFKTIPNHRIRATAGSIFHAVCGCDV